MTTLTSKGQVTIPKRLRDHLGLKPGAGVEFVINAAGEVVIVSRRRRGKTKLDRLVGFAIGKGPDLSTDEIMALTRGE